MAFMCKCKLCGYTIVAPNLKKLILYIIIHYAKSHYKTHSSFTIVCCNTLKREIEKIIDEIELKGNLLRKLKRRRPPYVTYYFEQYHKRLKHVIFYIIKMDPLDYLLLKQLNKKHKKHNLLIL